MFKMEVFTRAQYNINYSCLHDLISRYLFANLFCFEIIAY